MKKIRRILGVNENQQRRENMRYYIKNIAKNVDFISSLDWLDFHLYFEKYIVQKCQQLMTMNVTWSQNKIKIKCYLIVTINYIQHVEILKFEFFELKPSRNCSCSIINKQYLTQNTWPGRFHNSLLRIKLLRN